MKEREFFDVYKCLLRAFFILVMFTKYVSSDTLSIRKERDGFFCCCYSFLHSALSLVWLSCLAEHLNLTYLARLTSGCHGDKISEIGTLRKSVTYLKAYAFKLAVLASLVNFLWVQELVLCLFWWVLATSLISVS